MKIKRLHSVSLKTLRLQPEMLIIFIFPKISLTYTVFPAFSAFMLSKFFPWKIEGQQTGVH